MQIPNSVPRPLVRTNQATIVITVLLTWLTGWYALLLIPFVAGIGGIFFNYNFVIRFAKRFLRKPGSAYTPEDKLDLKFNQKIASAMLGLALISFVTQHQIAGYVFSGIVLAAASVAIMGFCVGCFIRYQLIQFKYRRVQKRNITE
ncbi:DUF4395 domain-containing protein [Periweissella cryptocerci]|uniref:DUF4395 domain-containing protein n=1 Tax=Periweissella cryptocerci TaxID=2506420 RepID=A0A4P6YUF9_9LACO|nr:DUF4395 domain-containing protein [Periweissella cryptocerci]QBO36343.1 DUF4395 domain-containing protein [Periweissella cryptocerci]